MSDREYGNFPDDSSGVGRHSQQPEQRKHRSRERLGWDVGVVLYRNLIVAWESRNI